MGPGHHAPGARRDGLAGPGQCGAGGPPGAHGQAPGDRRAPKANPGDRSGCGGLSRPGGRADRPGRPGLGSGASRRDHDRPQPAADGSAVRCHRTERVDRPAGKRRETTSGGRRPDRRNPGPAVGHVRSGRVPGPGNPAGNGKAIPAAGGDRAGAGDGGRPAAGTERRRSHPGVPGRSRRR